MTAALLDALPWLSIALVVLAFSLADDLPDPDVRRVFATIALAVLASAALAVWTFGAVPPSYALVAAGPLAFLAIHHALRSAFRRWKGAEPSVVTTGRSGGRFFFEKEQSRSVTLLDYLYTFLLGVVMLISAAPAIGVIVGGNLIQRNARNAPSGSHSRRQSGTDLQAGEATPYVPNAA